MGSEKRDFNWCRFWTSLRYLLWWWYLLLSAYNNRNFSKVFFSYFTVKILLITCHCRFLVPCNTQKILTKIWHHFLIKMMMKSGLEKNILKFHGPLQSCCCPVQKNLPRWAELAWLVSRYLWRGTWNFKIFFSRPLFTIILSQKWSFQDLRF